MRARGESWLGRTTLILLAATGVLAWAFWPRHRDSSTVVPPKEPVTTAPADLRPGAATGALRQREDGREPLSRAIDALKSAAGPEESRRALAQLHGLLSGMSPGAASAAICDLLQSGVDTPSQLDFRVGPDGFLQQPSSLRVFLLDQLARVDRAAAAAYAEEILNSFSSPDEWAVSLRNYALGNLNSEARVYLQQKVRAMIRHEPWQNNPSVGFPEAFDVAVHAGGVELIPDLTELLRQKENRAVAHAAYLALDRLTIQEQAAVLSELQSHPESMQGREETRANYFARANVEDPQQRMVLESYLLDPRRSEAELQTFGGLFPNANYAISHNLLTRNATPGGETLARQDREALKVVEAWMNDPRFERLRPRLQEIASRLEGFVGKRKNGQ